MHKPLLLAAVLLPTLSACSTAGDDAFEPAFGCPGAYPDAATSAYVLPYSAAQRYVVGQGSCTEGSHSEDQAFALDFDMPIGTTIVAARAGRVIEVEERFEDGTGRSGEENVVVVQHADGTVAGYYHLTRDGALVDVGDAVVAQQPIARSGNTGDSSEPHLHFEVLDRPDGDTVPVSFANTRAHPEGLVEGEAYEADFDD